MNLRILYIVSINCGLPGEAGGVLRLFRTYAKAAESVGHDVRLFSLWAETDWTSVDLVHMAPCDGSMLGVANALCEKGIRFVVSPILDKTFPAIALRAVACGDRLFGGYYRSHLGAAQEICRLSNGVCVMSADEGRRVKRGLGVSDKPIHIVRTAIADDVLSCRISTENVVQGIGESVLFVGDLANERKNVIGLMKACQYAQLPLILVGSLGDSLHGRRVRAALKSFSLVRYCGRISDRAAILSAMAQCRVFALPSMTEGIGLAALEAGAVGAKVVVTKHGGGLDYFGTMAWYVDPSSVQSIAAGLKKAWNAPKVPPLREHIEKELTLVNTACNLNELYASALGKELFK